MQWGTTARTHTKEVEKELLKDKEGTRLESEGCSQFDELDEGSGGIGGRRGYLRENIDKESGRKMARIRADN